jgi:hypothetical protein
MTDAEITALKADVLYVLDALPVCIESGSDGNYVLVTPRSHDSPARQARLMTYVANILSIGFDVSRSRTRVRVWRIGKRPALGEPDFVCGREGESR